MFVCYYVKNSHFLSYVPETSQSFPKLHVHNDLILRRNKYYTYVRLRDLFCILSVCSLRLFSSFLSGVPKERFSDVGVSFQHMNQRLHSDQKRRFVVSLGNEKFDQLRDGIWHVGDARHLGYLLKYKLAQVILGPPQSHSKRRIEASCRFPVSRPCSLFICSPAWRWLTRPRRPGSSPAHFARTSYVIHPQPLVCFPRPSRCLLTIPSPRHSWADGEARLCPSSSWTVSASGPSFYVHSCAPPN